jgi:hypothetical protein
MPRAWLVMHFNFAAVEMHYPLPHCADISSPYTFKKHQWMSMGAICSAVRNSITHLCFIHTSMQDAIFADCSAVAMSHDNQCNATLVGRFNLYNTTTNIRLKSYRTQKIGGIIYGTPLITLNGKLRRDYVLVQLTVQLWDIRGTVKA